MVRGVADAPASRVKYYIVREKRIRLGKICMPAVVHSTWLQVKTQQTTSIIVTSVNVRFSRL